jgi:hypothetical protein
LLQRRSRVINDLFDIFFSAESAKVYKPLLKLQVVSASRKVEHISKLLDEQKINISLGHVVQLVIHFSQALELTLLNTVVFNGGKSQVYVKDLDSKMNVLKLYIPEKGVYAELQNSLPFLEQNLARIVSSLRMLSEKEGLGRGDSFGDESEPDGQFYPNRILYLL